MTEDELVSIYDNAYAKAPMGGNRYGGGKGKKGAACAAVWNAAIDMAIKAVGSQQNLIDLKVLRRPETEERGQ